MINFFKRLFKLKRTVFMVDYDNRVAFYITKDYPESGFLTLRSDNNTIYLAVDQFVNHGKEMYTLQTPRGTFIMKYV